MAKLSKTERSALIASAIKTISEHKQLSPAARERGLKVLEKALRRDTDCR